MKLIAETTEKDPATKLPVKVRWYLADADELPAKVQKAVVK